MRLIQLNNLELYFGICVNDFQVKYFSEDGKKVLRINSVFFKKNLDCVVLPYSRCYNIMIAFIKKGICKPQIPTSL